MNSEGVPGGFIIWGHGVVGDKPHGMEEIQVSSQAKQYGVEVVIKFDKGVTIWICSISGGGHEGCQDEGNRLLG